MFEHARDRIDNLIPMYAEEVDLYADLVLHRVTPQFTGFESEAAEFGAAEFGRLASSPVHSEAETAELNDIARELAVERFLRLEGLAQGMLNLFTAGLYHLFEQQLFMLARACRLPPSRHANGAVDQLEKYGIKVRSLEVWQDIDELRLVANVSKHAQGQSAEDLMKRAPELFLHPKYQEPGDSPLPGGVNSPLAGSDLYVTTARFSTYAAGVSLFWFELWDLLIPPDSSA